MPFLNNYRGAISGLGDVTNLLQEPISYLISADAMHSVPDEHSKLGFAVVGSYEKGRGFALLPRAHLAVRLPRQQR
jgi:hypothetical protein